jgi:hypothetical protein
MTHPQAADGGPLDGNDLRAAMKIVYEHIHRIQRNLERAFSLLIGVNKNTACHGDDRRVRCV